MTSKYITHGRGLTTRFLAMPNPSDATDDAVVEAQIRIAVDLPDAVMYAGGDTLQRVATNKLARMAAQAVLDDFQWIPVYKAFPSFDPREALNYLVEPARATHLYKETSNGHMELKPVHNTYAWMKENSEILYGMRGMHEAMLNPIFGSEGKDPEHPERWVK
jgi:hypothetical protein